MDTTSEGCTADALSSPKAQLEHTITITTLDSSTKSIRDRHHHNGARLVLASHTLNIHPAPAFLILTILAATMNPDPTSRSHPANT